MNLSDLNIRFILPIPQQEMKAVGSQKNLKFYPNHFVNPYLNKLQHPKHR